MRYASVCDGIGAVHVAWQPLGWHCEWTAEIDAFPAAVVEQRWGFPNRGDMTRFRDWGDLDVDLLVGGTPCQAFSVAGLRRSLEDERGNLSLVFVNLMDAIDEERKRLGKPPAICVWENVPGVLSTKDNAFGCFLAGLAGEGVPLQPSGGKWSNAGYVLGPKRAIAWRVLDAQYFGVAQRRRRVFLVASARDGFSPAAVLFESESVRRDNPPSRAKGERASCPIAGCSNGGGANGPGRTADDADSLIPIWRGSDTTGSTGDGLARCITTGEAKRQDWETCNFVAFKPSHYTRGKDGKPSTVTAPLSADADKGDQDTVVAYDILGTPATNAAKPTDVHVPLRARLPGQSEASMTTVVAFTQNTRDEVRQINGDGQIAGALAANAGMKQTNYIAFANRTRDGIKVPEVMKDGVVPALLNPGGGGRSDAVNVVVPQAQAFTHNGYSNKPARITGDRTDCLPSSGHGDTSHQGIGVMTPMAVRRLTPMECERLQGFPDHYTAITYRNKPAADGPRYKALGNSMAVPVMAWIGHRIAENECATSTR